MSTNNEICIIADTFEKRSLSQTLSKGNGILREEHQIEFSNIPCIQNLSMESIATSMLPISAFPSSREEDIPIRNFISRRIMTMTDLTLDMHDEI